MLNDMFVAMDREFQANFVSDLQQSISVLKSNGKRHNFFTRNIWWKMIFSKKALPGTRHAEFKRRVMTFSVNLDHAQSNEIAELINESNERMIGMLKNV